MILIATGSEVQLAPGRPGAAARPRASPPGSCRCRARSGSARRTRPTASRCCRRAVKARVSVEAGVAHVAGATSSATPASASASSTSAPARRTRCCSSSSASPPDHVVAARPRHRWLGQVGAQAQTAGHRHGQPRRSTMTDTLAELSAAGVAIWLDDLSRERLASGNLDELRRDQHVVGVTTNPTIFAKALAERRRLRPSSSRDLALRGVGVEEAVADDHHVRRPLGLRRDAPGVRRDRRRGRPGLDRGRPAAGPRRPTRPSPRPRRCGGWSTGRTCSSRSRPPRPGSRRSPQTLAAGHQRQRHADLLAGALRRR